MRLAGFVAVGCLLASSGAAAGITVSAATPKGLLSCDSPGSQDLIGSVLRADAKSFQLDLCLPTQECSRPIVAEFSVAAPGFAGFQRYLLPAAFVTVKLAVERRDGGCSQQITVAGVASWVGARNPSGRGDEFYFAAGDGVTEMLGSVPFQSARCAGGQKSLELATGKTHVRLRTGMERSVGTELTARLLEAARCSSAQGWSYWVAGRPVR